MDDQDRLELERLLGPGRFEIFEPLGTGSFGTVYRARDHERAMEVALKVLKKRDLRGAAQLAEEFRRRADIHHPNLLQVFDLFVAGELAAFTMEVVRPESAMARIRAAFERSTDRAQETLAEQRLCHTFIEIASALSALHEAGLVHRDVKPSNILIRSDERAVVADFGLAKSYLGPPGGDRSGGFGGTAAYASPEQLWGDPLTPASDLYSLGVMVFEAVTGELPFERGILPARGRRPSELRPAIDPRLDALTEALLSPRAATRPTCAEVAETLRAIGETDRRVLLFFRPERPASDEVFIGRASQLAFLEERWREAAQQQGATIVHVGGPSGIGKTRLVRQLLRRIQNEQQALILESRCHPKEHISFRAVDRLINQLAEYLRAVDISEWALAQANELRALPRIFPIFETLLLFQNQARSDLQLDPTELREAGIRALALLLAHLAEKQRLLIWIDDFQWTDSDSIFLLKNLFSEKNNLSCLVIFSHRGEQPAPTHEFGAPSNRHQLQLERLSSGETEELFNAIIRENKNISSEALNKLAVTSNGVPYFVRELAQHVLSTKEDVASPSIEALIAARVEQLEPQQRALLDAITLSPWPVATEIALAITRVEASHQKDIISLCQMSLLRVAEGEVAEKITTFHDQVRAAHERALTPDRRSQIHRRFAVEYEATPDARREPLVYHWYGAGEMSRAGEHAELAGDEAMKTLAFDAASSFYARALECRPERGEPWKLEEKAGTVLAILGIGDRAGQHLESAAKSIADRGGPGEASTALWSRAAEQYFHAGQISDGYRIIHQVLGRLGARLPRSRVSCILNMIARRLGVILAGRPQPRLRRKRPELAPERIQRLDTLWAAASGLAHVNHAHSDIAQLMHVREALRSGDTSRLVKSLSFEAAAESTIGGRFFNWHAKILLQRSAAMLDENNAYDVGWVAVANAASATFRSDWSKVIEYYLVAEASFQKHGPGVAWERAITSFYGMLAYASLGNVAALKELHGRAFRDALARNDPLAQNHCRAGHPAAIWLFLGDLSTAKSEAALVLKNESLANNTSGAPGRWPEAIFRTTDYYNLISWAEMSLYENLPQLAFDRIETDWPHIEHALLLYVQFVAADLRFLRAKAALALAAQRERPELEKIARREMKRLKADSNPCARPFAEAIEAALHHRQKKYRAAANLYRSAAAHFGALGMSIHRYAAEYSAAGESAEHKAAACASLRALGIAEPEAIIRTVIPATFG